MEAGLMRKFADLALDAGLGLEAGAKLRILGEFPQRELMRAIAEGAYKRGASLVRLEYDDPRLSRIRAESSRDEYLDEVSRHLAAESQVFADESWYLLRLAGDEEPGVMEGADQERLTRIQRARGKAVGPLRTAQMASRIPWCVMPAATEGWAKKILGPEAGERELWELLAPILRLDRADPCAELTEHMAAVEARSRSLNALHLRELRFEGPGTRLSVALAPESRWLGGSDRSPEGHVFMPNIPTEETFATPDFRATEGRVALTRPVRIRGSLVEGGTLRFEKGGVVDFSATRGASALESYLSTDEGARRLGEVALVDSSNPIGTTGLIFDSPLIDENAACHIALGGGYDTAFEGATLWSDEEKTARGFNISIVHEDLMIGSPEMDVMGIDAEGREIPLMRKGRYSFSS
jgi:aminopeptidase